MTLKPLLALIIMSTSFGYASAATIEIKDGKDLIEQYSLVGVAYVCAESEELSTLQRLEMSQILDHYVKKMRQDGVSVDYSIARGAAEEKFGITYGNVNYQKCEKALKI